LTKKESFHFVFKEYFSPLHNYVNWQISDPDKARHIVHEAFLSVWDNWDTFLTQNKKRYLFNTVQNSLNKHPKKENNRALAKDEFDFSLIRSEALKTLEGLSPQVKNIFMLNTDKGMSYDQIAERLNVSETIVMESLGKAFLALRTNMVNNNNLFS